MVRKVIIRKLLFMALIVSVFFLAPGKSFGQVHYRFFYGKISIAGTKTPISNVNISFEGSKLGSVTDQKGNFSFYIDTIPIFMIVSHLGYKSMRILLDGTSNSLTLYMETAVNELQEVEIVANKVEPFFKDEHYTLRDFEIDSGYVYMLVYRNRISKEELICKNLEGDTVARSGILSFAPSSLFKDCLGYLHVIGADSVFQVFREEKVLRMIHAAGRKKFNEVLINCVASTTQVLFFKKMIDFDQGVEYYGIDRISKEKKILSMVEDEDKLKMLRQNPHDYSMLWQTLPGGRSVNSSLSSGVLGNDRATFDEWNWVHKALYRPMKTALYKIRDFICIFDIPKKELEFYDNEGNFSYKLKINIDAISDGRWSGDIYLDEDQSKVYTTFLKSTGTGLYRIDMNTGELHRKVVLIHPYPQKLKIFKDKVYYMYDVLGDPDNKTLYRQSL